MITHLVGGSSGREGAILQIGGSISSKIGRWMRLDDKDSRVITMCGMAAAFSALFGTPLTAAMFAMEVTSVGVLYYAAMVPCVLSAIVGLWMAQLFHVPATAFTLEGIPNLSPLTLLQVIGMGILFALLSIFFCRLMHAAPHLYEKYPAQPPGAGGGGRRLVIALTFLVWLWNPGSYDYNGAGEAVLHAAVSGQARPEAFLLKMLFTTITLGAGFKGGEIVPVFFTGATFGCTVGPLLGLHPSFGAGLGMVCVFCGVTNCPISSLLLALELFAGDSLGHVHRPEPVPVRGVPGGVLHALGLLRPVQRAEDPVQQAAAGVHRQKGQRQGNLKESRSFDMLRFDHFNFNVLDLERSLKFYSQALELKPVKEKNAADGSFRLVYLGDGESDFRLELTWLRDRTEPYDLGEQEFHLAFRTDRFDELLERHRAMGCVCFENPGMGIYFIEDPDGYWIELVPDKH